MIDIEQRLRRTFSSMAGNEALSDALDEAAATTMLKWGEEVAEFFVRQTGEMDDEAAETFLAPYLSALRKLMRAVGGWAAESDSALRAEWWVRIEKQARALYGEAFVLPAMPEVIAQLQPGSSAQQAVELVRSIINTQKPQG